MAHAHASFLAGVVLFSITSAIFFAWILFSKMWNRIILVPAFFTSVVTLIAMLTGWFDIDIFVRPDGTTYAFAVLVLLVVASLPLSYGTGAFLHIDTEASLLAHFVTLVDGSLLAWGAKLNNDIERWTIFGFAMLFYVTAIYILWSQRTRRDMDAMIVLIATTIFWTIPKILWIFGEGSDVMRFGNEITLLVLTLVVSHALIPFYMAWNIGVATLKIDANGKETYYLWRISGPKTYASKSEPLRVSLFDSKGN